MAYTNPITAVTGSPLAASDWNAGVRDNLNHLKNAISRSATLVVAASNSSQKCKDAADYVCLGSNDLSQIQAAIYALPSGGGIIQLTEGTYSFGGGLGCLGGTWIRGMGRATILKLQNGMFTDIDMITAASGVNNITISDLTIDGNSANQTTNILRGSAFTNGSHIVISNVNYINFRETMCYFIGVTDIRVTDCTFEQITSGADVVHGIRTTDCTNIKILCCSFKAIPNRAVYIDGTSITGIVEGCIAISGLDSGFVIDGTAKDIIIQGCQAYLNGAHGFYIIGTVSHCLIQGCISRDNSQTTTNTYCNFAIGGTATYNDIVNNMSRVTGGGLSTPLYAIYMMSGTGYNFCCFNECLGQTISNASGSNYTTFSTGTQAGNRL